MNDSFLVAGLPALPHLLAERNGVSPINLANPSFPFANTVSKRRFAVGYTVVCAVCD